MKDFGTFLSNVIEKFDIKKLLFCVFVVLALMLIPEINFLSFLMPLDTAEKKITFVFALIASYVTLSSLIFLWECIRKYFECKPKRLIRLLVKYGEYINIFYSDEIGEYSACSFNYERCGIPVDIINKLKENNIIECSGYRGSNYCLTPKARKKLTKVRKFVTFVNRKIINRNQQEEQ